MSAHARRAPRWRFIRCQRVSSGGGQAMVELALILPVVSVVLVIGLQYAVIGTAALALGQVNYQGARYAAINSSADQSAVQSYMLSVASPIISANSGKYLCSTMTPAPPCSFGSSVKVSLTFDSKHLVVLPNPFLGINFPTSLNSSESAFCE